MELLIADECSLTWDTQVGFFIYGGIVVNETEARPLAIKLLEIKQKYTLPKERPVKWNNAKWNGSTLDEEVHKNIKDEVLTIFTESSAKIIVCMSPHQFYHNPSLGKDGKIIMSIDPATQTRSHEYGMNDLLGKFSRYVGNENYGMVLADEFGSAVKAHMEAHCANSFPENSKYNIDNIIHPVIQLNNEGSYLHQINDVVLGAIYFSFREMEHNFLPRIKNNFWAVDSGTGLKITGNGFNIYPLRPQYEWCQTANRNLQLKFNRLISQV